MKKKVMQTEFLNGSAAFAGPRNFRRTNLRLPLHNVQVLARVGNKVKINTRLDHPSEWLIYSFINLGSDY